MVGAAYHNGLRSRFTPSGPRFDSQGSQECFLGCCWDLLTALLLTGDRQKLYNVNRTHLVLASGKLVLQNNIQLCFLLFGWFLQSLSNVLIYFFLTCYHQWNVLPNEIKFFFCKRSLLWPKKLFEVLWRRKFLLLSVEFKDLAFIARFKITGSVWNFVFVLSLKNILNDF